jgi:transcriptional regulator GlxA family with amidase domain
MPRMFVSSIVDSQGDAMHAWRPATGHFSQIARVLYRIHPDSEKRIGVDTMCNESAVSVLMFHRLFSAVTYTTPIRDLKSTRLHQARPLVIRTELTLAVR